ncbi:hypothetical protein ACIPRU_27525 [Streptomyces sp. NPDC090126]|uniref:hypothetical protein n=1 Tax=Streptomyces sp. NPDC090126 TaxID=3365952 RepID=UPI0037F65559
MFSPWSGVQGVPGPYQVTVGPLPVARRPSPVARRPSPVAHTICDTFAVAVTLPTVADADAGPNVEGDEFARIHISMPTTHFPAARGLATSGPVSFIKAAARRATASGAVTGAAAGPGRPGAIRSARPARSG